MKQLVFWLLAAVMVCGCASQIPHKVASDYAKKGAKLIAVMPVNNLTTDTKAAQILREKIINELYFKGYPKIPSGVIDEKLSSLYGKTTEYKKDKIPPKIIGDQLGADAIMYCTLNQFKTSYFYVYAPTTVSITLELQNIKTGATLWSTSYETVKRSYGISKKRLEIDAIQVYEPAIQEVLDKTMETLPDRPDI